MCLTAIVDGIESGQILPPLRRIWKGKERKGWG